MHGIRIGQAPAGSVMRSAGAFLTAVVLCFGFGTRCVAQGFTVPIVVSDGTKSVELTVGMHRDATDGDDVGIDILAPPPAPGGLDARLRFEDEDYFTDIRGFNTREKIFEVRYRGYDEAKPLYLLWDPAGLEKIGTFEIYDVFDGSFFGPVDMTATDSLCISEGDGYLRDALRIRVKLADTYTSVEDGEGLPRRVKLDPNYPNPFNPETTIGFHLDRPSKVTLTVYDMLGRPVAVPLQQAVKGAGSHKVVYRAEGLPSGVYLYVLEASGVRQTRQMLLHK